MGSVLNGMLLAVDARRGRPARDRRVASVVLLVNVVTMRSPWATSDDGI